VVAVFAPIPGSFLAILRHVCGEWWNKEDEDAVRHGAPSQISDLYFLRVQAGV